MPFSAGTFTSPAPSPQSSSPGACSRFGSATKPPSGIVFAPHATRSPPSRMLPHERVRLQLLEQVVHRELGVAVVEPDDHPDRDHVVAHRVDERAAELAVLRARRAAASPSCGSRGRAACATFQTSFTPSAHTCGFSPCEPEAVERDAGQVALRPLGRGRSRARARRSRARSSASSSPFAPAAAVAGAHAAHAAVARRAASSPTVSGRIVAPRLLGLARRASGRAATATRRSCRGSSSSAAPGCAARAVAVRK